MKEKKVRQLAAVMFTDIVGYTALMESDEEGAVKVRSQHRKVFQQEHETHQGEIIQYYGDGTLSIFKSAIEAVQCAIGIQRLLKEGDPVRVRVISISMAPGKENKIGLTMRQPNLGALTWIENEKKTAKKTVKKVKKK